jgi:plastocyanin
VLRLPDDPPVVLTFTTPGTYEYQCIPHGVVMKATVVVQEAGAAVADDQAAVDARGERERAALIEEGRAERARYEQATATRRDDGTTLWEVAAGVGEGQARVFRFLPDTLAVKTGDTVRWVNRSKTEPHTVTFLGAGAEQPEDILVEPQPSGPPVIVQNPLTLFPQGGRVYRGEGYVNSGFLGELNGQPLPGGPAFELTFDAAGEYPYYCILHAGGPATSTGWRARSRSRSQRAGEPAPRA